MLHFPSPQPGVSRLALLHASKWTQVWFSNKIRSSNIPRLIQPDQMRFIPRKKKKRLVQNLENNQCNLPYLQREEGKSYDHLKRSPTPKNICKNATLGTSLVAQWLRSHLPLQRTRVRALVREDPTCRGATKPVHHNYLSLRSRAHVPQRLSPRATTTEACAPRACAPEEKPPQWEACAPQQRVDPAHHN